MKIRRFTNGKYWSSYTTLLSIKKVPVIALEPV